jgi:hypothetical protein
MALPLFLSPRPHAGDPNLAATSTQASVDQGYLLMKRTVMRYRANDSRQAWPGQAIEAVLARESLRRFFHVPISSLDTMTARWRQRDIPAASHTLITSGRFKPSFKIDCNRYPSPSPHPDRLVQPIFRSPSRRRAPKCSPTIFPAATPV